ncbi:MAG: hypothetical protein IJN96_05380 [Clostridia bacterium]|nr:hypothetical protein [Clostridia bacterium]
MVKVFKSLLSTILILSMLLNIVAFGATVENEELLASLNWTSDFEQGEWKNGEAAFSVSGFEPGSEAVRYFKIENAGELAFSYEMKMIASEIGEMASVLDVYYKKGISSNTAVKDMTKIGTLAEVLGGLTVAEGSIVPEGESVSTADTKETVVAVAFKMTDNVPKEFMNKGTGEFSIQLNLTSFDEANKFKVKFDNTDKYLYRVGNANDVALSSLFETVDGADVGNVSVVINSLDANTDVAGTYTANASNWGLGTIKFSGTGPVEVTIDDDGYANALSLKLEVVDATNFTSYSSKMAETNSVFLNDIKMSSGGSIMLDGKSLYGNGFTFDVTDGAYASSGYITGNYVIRLDNSILDNVKVEGAVYTEYGATRLDAYNRATVLVCKDSVIANSYISNCAAPVRVNGGNLEIANSTLKGGNFANVDIRGGNVVLDNVTTINQVNGNDLAADGTVVAGFGVVVYYEQVPSTTTVEIRNGITQYNNLSKKQASDYIKDTSAKQLTDVMFGSSCSSIQYTDANSDVWVNCGILSMTSNVADANISDIDGYSSANPVFAGKTGYVYSKVPDATSISVSVPTYHSTAQAAIAPLYSFEYPESEGNKNYVAKVEGSNDYCVMTDGMVTISMDAGDVFSWDTSILNVTKAGKALDYTVTMNGTDYTGKTIDFDTAGNYVVTYTCSDENNYSMDSDGNIIVYEKTYRKSVNINVDVVKAAWKNAEIMVDTSEIASMSEYVMTGDYDYQYKMYFLGCVTVTDYDETGNATVVDLDSGISSYTFSTSTGSNGTIENTGILTLNYSNGKTFKVNIGNWKGSGPSAKTCTVNISDNNVYIITDGASNAANIDVSWDASAFTYTGNNGATVTNNTTASFLWNEQTKGYNSKSSGGCVTGDTLITLADGSGKRIDQLTYEDNLLVWNFFEGEYDVVPPAIIFNHGINDNEIVKLTFDDKSEIKIIMSHEFFDVDANEFVIVNSGNVESYIGHKFLKADGDEFKAVELTDYEVWTENCPAYGVITALHYNAITGGFLTTNFEEQDCGLHNYFEVGEDLTFDREKMEADIEQYGLYKYEDFADYLTPEFFEGYNVKYMKVAVGKGQYTYQGMIDLIQKWLVDSDEVLPNGQEKQVAEEDDTSWTPGYIPYESDIEALTDDEPQAIEYVPETKTITLAGNSVAAANYAIDVSGEGLEEAADGYLVKEAECDVVLAAGGTATTGYAKILVGEDVYYTNQIANGENFILTLKNAVGKAVSVEAFWGNSANYDVAQDALIESGKVIEYTYTVEITATNATEAEGSYAVTENESVFTLTANGSATPGYAKISVNGDDYYTEAIAKGETFTFTVNNARGKMVAIETFYGEPTAENLIASGSEIGYVAEVTAENATLNEDGKYVVDADEATITVTASGTSEGYAKITVGEEVYYTKQIASGESFVMTLKNAKGKIFDVETIWAKSENDGVAQDVLIESGKVIEYTYTVEITATNATEEENGYLVNENESVFTLKASGTATMGYATIAVDGDVYYTQKIVPNEEFKVTVKNAKGKTVGIASFYGEFDDEEVLDEYILGNEDVIDCGTFSIKSVEGTTVVLSNTTKYASETVDIYVAVYDSQNRMIAVKQERNVSVGGKTEHTFDSKLVIPENGYAKVFVWSGTDALKPVFGAR